MPAKPVSSHPVIKEKGCVSCHDPQGTDGKRRPFADAAEGAVGLETLLPAALLVLQKKVRAIWGDEDDDTDDGNEK